MLCLRRKERESITIGDDIKIVVLRIGNGEVSIGIEAPESVRIVRDDAKIREEIKR